MEPVHYSLLISNQQLPNCLHIKLMFYFLSDFVNFCGVITVIGECFLCNNFSPVEGFINIMDGNAVNFNAVSYCIFYCVCAFKAGSKEGWILIIRPLYAVSKVLETILMYPAKQIRLTLS